MKAAVDHAATGLTASSLTKPSTLSVQNGASSPPAQRG
jgi:hypothetical protein